MGGLLKSSVHSLIDSKVFFRVPGRQIRRSQCPASSAEGDMSGISNVTTGHEHAETEGRNMEYLGQQPLSERQHSPPAVRVPCESH